MAKRAKVQPHTARSDW